MAKRDSVSHFWKICVILVVGFCQVADSQVVIKNCLGNVYSKTGEAAWTLPTAEVTDAQGNFTTILAVTCNQSPDSTLYKEYQTEVACTATDADKNTATCSFNIFLADGVGCDKKGGTAQCVCVEYRPYFDPCECNDGYSGLDCQVKDGSGCTGSNDPTSCDCSTGTCGCKGGFKGVMCEFDFQPPVITCPEDIFSAEASSVLPPFSALSASDNDGSAATAECDPPLGSPVNGTGNTTIFTVACSARDTAGNKAHCSFRVVLDTEPPKIPYCLGTVHTNNSNLVWPLDIAVDNSHPRLNVTCVPAPGDDLTAYMTEVTCGVEDAAGNAAEESCTFKIYLDGGSCTSGDTNCECDAGINCGCATGFSGLNCSVEDGNGCISSGDPGLGCECHNDTSSCMCRDGFKGARCEIDFQPPELSNCPFGEIWSYTPVVTYRPMWTADNSDTDQPAPEVTCYPREGSAFYEYRMDVTCSVEDPSGNKDSDCEFPVRRSSASDCSSDGNNCYNCDRRCRCLPGYYGPKCQVCGSCNNGGSRDDGQCRCQCPTLHHGLICSECYEPNADHCLNGGTFIVDTCSCECQGDWSGRHCTQKHAEECPDPPTGSDPGCSCDSNGCSCNDGYEGPKCEACKACDNGGENQDSETCACECRGYFKQPLCSECDTNVTCQNSGQLNEASCTCQCTDGWTGKDCSEAVTFASQCPSDIIKRLDEGKTTAQVTWTDPTDAANPGAVIDCKPASGSEFNEGTTHVKCTATDTGGSSVTCGFQVSIDERAPLVNCPDDITAYHQRWITTSHITWASVKGEDEVSGTVPATCIPPSGSVFSGETTVVCTAFDEAMNLGLCTFIAGVYLRGNTLRFPTTMSCAKCYKDNPEGRCSYDNHEDEYTCYCSSGFTVKDDGRTCQDIDECADEDLCDRNAQCDNTVGSYRCQCNTGFYGSGSTCREYPYTVYPDIPTLSADKTTLEKKIAIDVAIADDSMYGCDPNDDPMSSQCSILMSVFTRHVRERYNDFSPALLRIEVDQHDLTSGSIPHVVVYDYARLSASDRAASAQACFDDTMASSVDSGKMGGLKLVKDCANCQPPKDLTNLCDNLPKPECDDGFFLREVRATDNTTCYLTCESLCSTDYCGAGTCIHIPPYEAECRCPSNTAGPRCEPVTTTDGVDDDGDDGDDGGDGNILNLPLIIGCSVGGGVLLILILAIVAYYMYSKKKTAAKKAYLEKHGKANDSFVMEER